MEMNYRLLPPFLFVSKLNNNNGGGGGGGGEGLDVMLVLL
jgi:hypothetical protein